MRQILAVRVYRVVEEDLQHHVFVVQIGVHRVHRPGRDQVLQQHLARVQIRDPGAVARDGVLHAFHGHDVLGQRRQHAAGRDHDVIALLHRAHDGRPVGVGQLAVVIQQRIVHVEGQDADLVQPLL